MKHCPNCGFEIDDEAEFCSECGFDLNEKTDTTNIIINENKSFFTNLKEKTNIPVIIFSFIIFGVFLFVDSLFWSLFLKNAWIDFLTFLLLTVVFSVFFAAMFTGYYTCKDQSYVLPNFSVFTGSIFAVLLSVFGLVFTFLTGFTTVLSSISPGGSSSGFGSSYPASGFSSVDLSGFFKIVLMVLLISVAAYFGVYLGYYIKKNI
ncbi:MAG: zinc-ribbon domain-containing protein [Methanobrevibacter thaueri]|nr:zinc-ribbon domain-containing protein [Methanobrevibacter thaueri]